jgi:hypothetical protein
MLEHFWLRFAIAYDAISALLFLPCRYPDVRKRARGDVPRKGAC